MNETAQQEKLLGERHPIIDQCKGCDRVVVEINRCSSYLYPDAKWRLGNCPLATHTLIEEKSTGKVRVGQQKQKKKTRKK